VIDFARRASPKPPILVTSEERERLLALKTAASEELPEVARFLSEELERADIIPAGAPMPASLVRMNSAVTFLDSRTDVIQYGRLVYPEEASSSPDAISILTSTGVALLGLGPGQSITWITSSGEMQCATLLEVCFDRAK
jgi:regulator of nucleoside diphosphate kinase